MESYFSSDEDGNLDRLKLLECSLEEASETLYVVIHRSEDLSSQNPNNPEMAQFNADTNVLCRHLNVLRSHFGAQAAEEAGRDKELYLWPTENSGNTGRTRYLISVQQLQFLRDTFFMDKNSQNSWGVKKNNKSKETGAGNE